MLPLIAGFLVAGPASGYLSDRFGARRFATGGMTLAAASFLLLIVLPVDFAYRTGSSPTGSAAVASLLRGGKYHHVEATSPSATGYEPVEPDVA
jgi:MFS family permease